MASDALSLNIGGAQADLASIQGQHAILEATAAEAKATANVLFTSGLVGGGADAGMDFTHRMDDAVLGCGEVVHMLQATVGKTSDETVGFDQGGFAGNYA